MSDANDNQTNDPNRPNLQAEAQRLAEAARERATDVFEEIKVNSNQVVDRVRELIEEGNVRRIALKKGDRTLFEIPLTVGAGAAAALALFNPMIAGLGFVAGLASEVRLVVQREGAEDVDLGEAARGLIDDATETVKNVANRASGKGAASADDEKVANANSGSGDDAGSGATGSGDAGSSSQTSGGSDSSASTPDKTVGRSADAGSGSGKDDAA